MSHKVMIEDTLFSEYSLYNIYDPKIFTKFDNKFGINNIFI